MRSCLAFFVFLFIFLPIASCTLLTASISTWLLDRDFYTDLFSTEGFYATLVGGNLDLESALNLGGSELDPTTRDAFDQAFQQVLSPSYVRNEVLRNINIVFDYLEDTSRGLTLSIDLTPIKRSLGEAQIEAFANALVQALPPCASNSPPADTFLPTCLPTNEPVQQVIDRVRQNASRFIEGLPDIQVIGEPIPPNTESGSILGDAVQGIVGSVFLLLLGAFFVWLFVGILSARSIKGFWSALGISLLIPALPILLLGLATASGAADSTFADSIESALLEAGVQATPEIRQSTLAAVERVVSRISNGFLIYGGGATAVAVLLLIVGAAMPNPRKRKDEGSGSGAISPLR